MSPLIEPLAVVPVSVADTVASMFEHDTDGPAVDVVQPTIALEDPATPEPAAVGAAGLCPQADSAKLARRTSPARVGVRSSASTMRENGSCAESFTSRTNSGVGASNRHR